MAFLPPRIQSFQFLQYKRRAPLPVLERKKAAPLFLLSAQSGGLTLIVPDSRRLLPLNTIVSDHSRVFPDVFSLNLQTCLWLLGFQHEVVVAVRAVLVALLERLHVFAEDFPAFLACEDHLGGAFELVVLLFSMALCAVEPLPAAWRADCDLGVEDVFAG